MNNLTKRQKTLLHFLISEEEYKTIGFYSQKMGVSDRTVHNDLEQVKGYLIEMGAPLAKTPGVGIKIKANQDIKLSLLKRLDLKNEEVDPLSTKMRKLSILTQLLSSKKGTSLQKLSDEYMVSKTSIVKDLDKIEEWLSNYNLKLIRNREGTKVAGSEERIRKAIAGVIEGYFNPRSTPPEEPLIKSRMDEATVIGLSNMFQPEEIAKVENIITEAENKLAYKISEPYYTNLITHILILISRIKSGNKLLINRKRDAFEEVNHTETYSVAEFISNSIATTFSIQIVESEIIYINQYLMSSGVEKEILNSNTDAFIGNLDESLKLLVHDMLALSSKVTSIDLDKDQELYLGLLMHVKPMINRLRCSITIKNPLLEDIKKQHSAAFGMTWLVCSVIENKLGLKVNEDEIGYITLHFQAAIERQIGAKKVIVVCPGGIGTSHLIANRLKRYVPQIDVIDVVSLSRIKTIDLNQNEIDIIISTVPLEIEEKPVIVISSLVNQTDIKNINNFFTEFLYSPKKHESVNFSNIMKVIDKELIFTNVKSADKQGVLDFLCNQLEKRGYVSDDFKQSVLNRENLAPTSLGNKVAIPHGEHQYVFTPKISIAILDESINWGKDPVKIVFLIALKFSENSTSVKEVITDLYQVFESPSLLEKMENCQTPDELISLLWRE